jgi:hypothetical protein
MGAQPKEMPRKADRPEHYYHADAYVLKADIEQPLRSEVPAQGLVELPEDGAYQYKEVGPFKVKGILSYSSGYTQVGGHPSSKGHGFTTLSTSVIENLNVLNVVTADRVVGQISTEHPEGDDAVPSVTFLGTRFVNLRIGGHRVEIDQDIHVLGSKPKKDASYFEDSGALTRMTRQFDHIRKMKNLPEWAEEEFARDKGATKRENKAELSLVNSVNGAPGANFGHVIDVPHFGKIYLGELTIERKPEPRNSEFKDQYTFKLRMIRLDMGCIGTGDTTAVALAANGKGKGSGGG